MRQGLVWLSLSLLGMGIVPAQQERPVHTLPMQIKTLSYRGVLVDTSCLAPASGQPTASEGTARSVGGCAVKATTTSLGMKLDDGRVMRFDLVGTQRAQDQLKTNKQWSKELQAGKQVHVTVDGVMSGDKLVVMAIH